MISIISASNREGNVSMTFARFCQEILERNDQKVQLFSLDELPSELVLQSVYNYGESIFSKIGDKYIYGADKLLFIAPEYNGSIPGILKLFLDGIEPKKFVDKKAALIGISAGRAGNIRGMDHLTDILHYLQVHVLPNKLPVSQIYQLMENGQLIDETTRDLLEIQCKKLMNY